MLAAADYGGHGVVTVVAVVRRVVGAWAGLHVHLREMKSENNV